MAAPARRIVLASPMPERPLVTNHSPASRVATAIQHRIDRDRNAAVPTGRAMIAPATIDRGGIARNDPDRHARARPDLVLRVAMARADRESRVTGAE